LVTRGQSPSECYWGQRVPSDLYAGQRGPTEQVTNYSSETPLCNIVTEGKEPGVWYPDDVEKSANMDKTLGIPEVSDARLIGEEIIFSIVGLAVALIALIIWFL
jgi:hypothetical protein